MAFALVASASVQVGIHRILMLMIRGGGGGWNTPLPAVSLNSSRLLLPKFILVSDIILPFNSRRLPFIQLFTSLKNFSAFVYLENTDSFPPFLSAECSHKATFSLPSITHLTKI